MNNRKQSTFRSRYWLLILSILSLSFMLLSWYTDAESGPIEFVASYTISPMQEGINSIGLLARDFVENFETLEELRTKNEELQGQVDNLIIENSRLEQNSYELERLQELYHLDANSSEYEKVAARVISKEAGNWFHSFTIDKGTKDGLAVDMNVIAGSGLVGIVTKVGDNWATVRSIIADNSSIGSMVLSTGDNCIVTGDLTSINEGVIHIEQLPMQETEIEIGEPVVTSYISDKYVQGLTIGFITKLEEDPNGLTQSGYITPAVDFSQLQEVLVITDLKETGDETTSGTDTVEETLSEEETQEVEE